MYSAHNIGTNKSCVSPILRRVFSRSGLHVQNPSSGTSISNGHRGKESQRSESRVSTEMSMRSGASSLSGGISEELSIDVTTEENVQFMDQPLRGKIDLSGLPAPVETVSIALRAVVNTCVPGNAAWPSGFGGDSNVTARFTEKEVSSLMGLCADIRSSNKTLPCILAHSPLPRCLLSVATLYHLYSCFPDLRTYLPA